MKIDRKIEERFFSNVHTEQRSSGGCWIWSGGLFNVGYGQIRVGHKKLGAHRVSWMIHRGEIPTGLLVCHKCDVRSCVNPEHLFLGTYKDNTRDMDRKKRRITRSGENNGRAVLTNVIVAEIRKSYVHGSREFGCTSLGHRFGVSRATIWLVVAGKLWTNA